MLLPVRTDRPRIRPAYLTISLIVICTLVQVLSTYLMVTHPEMVTLSHDGESITFPESPLISQFGLRGDQPTLVTFFTHMFVHGGGGLAGWLHLLGNMLFLWIFGSLIEDALRPLGFALLYLGGGVMAALAHIAMSLALGQAVDIPMVGASGAIAAIMGLFMLRFYRTRVEIQVWFIIFRLARFWVPSVWALIYWVGLEVVNGVLSAVREGGGGTAHWAHVGGFVAGALAAPFLGSVSAARDEYITDDPHTNVEYVRRSEFVAAAEKALKADPGNAYQMRRLAQSYNHAGEYEQATQAYQACIVRFASRGMVEQAADVYMELLAYNDTPALPAEVLLKLAQHLEPSHLPQALAGYQVLSQQHPTRPEAEFALLRLALLHQSSLSRPYEAAQLFYEFLNRYPRSQWAPQARASYDQLLAQLPRA